LSEAGAKQQQGYCAKLVAKHASPPQQATEWT
jgi:hypothetical protein